MFVTTGYFTIKIKKSEEGPLANEANPQLERVYVAAVFRYHAMASIHASVASLTMGGDRASMHQHLLL